MITLYLSTEHFEVNIQVTRMPKSMYGALTEPTTKTQVSMKYNILTFAGRTDLYLGDVHTLLKCLINTTSQWQDQDD